MHTTSVCHIQIQHEAQPARFKTHNEAETGSSCKNFLQNTVNGINRASYGIGEDE